MKRKLILLLAIPFSILGIVISLTIVLLVGGYLSKDSSMRRIAKAHAQGNALLNYSKYNWE
jgi:hypothetical protein